MFTCSRRESGAKRIIFDFTIPRVNWALAINSLPHGSIDIFSIATTRRVFHLVPFGILFGPPLRKVAYLHMQTLKNKSKTNAEGKQFILETNFKYLSLIDLKKENSKVWHLSV